MKKFLAYVVLIFLCFGIPVVMYISLKDNYNYIKNGTDVEATIISAEKNGVRANSGYDVKVIYTDKEGNLITAKGITNDGDVTVGRVFEGKVLEDKPEEVYKPPEKGLLYTVVGLFGAFFLIGWLVLISNIFSRFSDKKIYKKGILTRAQVLSCERAGDNVYLCSVMFRDKNGMDVSCEISSSVPYGSGLYVNIKYMPEKNGVKAVILGY